MSTPPNVPLLDLKAQHAAIRDEIHAAVDEVIDSQYFILGPKVGELECAVAGYCGSTYAVGCASGSDAILLALRALEIGPGDEVICPSYTFFATGGYIHNAGATPVFVDIDPVTCNLDPEGVRAAAGKCRNLKAIMPVHLFGQCADMDALLEIGREFGVPIVEDAAQAIGARDATGARAGTRGTLGCFSFFPTKNLGAHGDGGIVTTNDEALAERLMMLRNHGSRVKYHHDFVGYNSRLDALQAAVLKVKLPHLDSWSAGRRENAALYDRLFAEAGATTSAKGWQDDALPLVTPAPATGKAEHIYNQYVIRVPAEHRDALRQHLNEHQIGTEIYYPIPLHLQKCFASLGYRKGDLPQSERVALESIALPIFAELTDEQQKHVAETIITYLRTHAAPGTHAAPATSGQRANRSRTAV